MSDDPVSFERDVKPLFRERDRGAMEWAFDLWSYDDVSANADAILGRSRAAPCPATRLWDADRVDTFRRWAQGQGRLARQVVAAKARPTITRKIGTRKGKRRASRETESRRSPSPTS